MRKSYFCICQTAQIHSLTMRRVNDISCNRYICISVENSQMTEAIDFHNECSKECINCIFLSGNTSIYYTQNIVPVAECAGLSITLSLSQPTRTRYIAHHEAYQRHIM